MAVSLAAKTFGVPAHIVMPKSSPRVKQESVRGYGGNITLCDQPTEEVGAYLIYTRTTCYNFKSAYRYLLLNFVVKRLFYTCIHKIRIFHQSRGAATKRVLEKLGPGAMFISSANDSNIMAGQGTIAVEFLEQV